MNKKKINLIGVIIFSFIIISLVIKNVIENHSLNENSNYTVGKIKGIEPNIKSGYRIIFIYYVQGKKYEAFAGIYKKNKSMIGTRYYVKFSPSNPKNCKILLDKPVPDRIKDIPPDGWKCIPK